MNGIRKNPIIIRITAPTTPAEAIQGNPTITVIPAKAGIQGNPAITVIPAKAGIQGNPAITIIPAKAGI